MKFVLILSFLFQCFFSLAQEPPAYSVYLIGDAGEDEIPGKALLMLKDELLKNPNSTVLFLGDNIYPCGLKRNDHKSALKLESQLQILNEYKGQVYFIPGNHDWNAQKSKGLIFLKNQELYVEQYLKTQSVVANKSQATFLPKNGLPGPETVKLKDNLRLIIIDTQWFLHLHKKNTIVSKNYTKELFYKRLDSLLEFSKNNHEQVIVAAHHPLYSNGKHAKSKQPFRFLVNYTPFQLFGLMGINRLYSQDLSQPRYKKMRNRMLDIFNKYENIIFVSGHEHNIQCYKQNGNRYIVSGSGSKRSSLLKKKKFESAFQDDARTGFVKINYTTDTYYSTIIYRVGEKELIIEGY